MGVHKGDGGMKGYGDNDEFLYSSTEEDEEDKEALAYVNNAGDGRTTSPSPSIPY